MKPGTLQLTFFIHPIPDLEAGPQQQGKIMAVVLVLVTTQQAVEVTDSSSSLKKRQSLNFSNDKPHVPGNG